MFPSPSSVAFEPEYEPVWFSKERVVLTWHDQDHNEALQDHTESDIDAYPQGYASCTMLLAQAFAESAERYEIYMGYSIMRMRP
jgi:hypothetical protein